MLKRWLLDGGNGEEWQPPSGGCVLKQKADNCAVFFFKQPPSGGCVLKLKAHQVIVDDVEAAAFRRLCVETSDGYSHSQAPRRSRLQAAVC